MSVGNQASSTQLNAQLAALAIGIRVWAYQVNQLQATAVALGQAGLVTAGFASADATSFTNMVSYLNTIAGVYQGTAAQTPAFNFDNALCLVRGVPGG